MLHCPAHSTALPTPLFPPGGNIYVDAPRPGRIYLPGSFNPLHDGHRDMLEVSACFCRLAGFGGGVYTVRCGCMKMARDGRRGMPDESWYESLVAVAEEISCSGAVTISKHDAHRGTLQVQGRTCIYAHVLLCMLPCGPPLCAAGLPHGCAAGLPSQLCWTA